MRIIKTQREQRRRDISILVDLTTRMLNATNPRSHKNTISKYSITIIDASNKLGYEGDGVLEEEVDDREHGLEIRVDGQE